MKHIICKDLLLTLRDYPGVIQGLSTLTVETTKQGKPLLATFRCFKDKPEALVMLLRWAEREVFIEVPERYWETPLEVVAQSYCSLNWS